MPSRRPHAVILPAVLVMIGMLTIMMAGFVFFVQAEAEGIRAFSDSQQARLVAESGMEEIIAPAPRRHPRTPRLGTTTRTSFTTRSVWAQGLRTRLRPDQGSPPPAISIC